MVGKTGFEPATSRSQTACSTKLSYFPLFFSCGSLLKNLMAGVLGFEPRQTVLETVVLPLH